MRHQLLVMLVASTCVLGLAGCSGSSDSEPVDVPASNPGQGDGSSTPGSLPSPIPETGSDSELVDGPEAELVPETGPETDLDAGPTAGDTPNGPPGSELPSDVGPPPDFGPGPDGSAPDTAGLDNELQNAASGDQIMDSWVCSTPTGSLDYGFVQGKLRYIDTDGLTINGTYNVTSGNSVSVALNTGSQHTLSDIAFVPIDNESINRYFTAQHSSLGAVTCVLT